MRLYVVVKQCLTRSVRQKKNLETGDWRLEICFRKSNWNDCGFVGSKEAQARVPAIKWKVWLWSLLALVSFTHLLSLVFATKLIGQRRTINKEDKGSWESWNKGTNAGTGIKEGFEPGFRIGVKKGAAE